MNPSNLIELYIQEVTRRLPEQGREDIALELRSTIEDMLPDEYGEAEVKEALMKLGNPAALAAQYRDQPQYLIGPHYYETYIQLMKMVLPIAAVIGVIVVFADQLFAYTASVAQIDWVDFMTDLIGGVISQAVSVMLQAAFWITLVFAILERSGVKESTGEGWNRNPKGWTPEELYRIRNIPVEKRIAKTKVFFDLLVTAIGGCIFFNADRLIVVYESGQNGLERLMPVFNQDVLLSYWPWVVLWLALDVTLSIYKWLAGQWTYRMAALNAAVYAVTLCVFASMLLRADTLISAAFHVKMGEWFGYTHLADGGFTQVSLLWITFLAIALAVSIDTWQGFRKAGIQTLPSSYKWE